MAIHCVRNLCGMRKQEAHETKIAPFRDCNIPEDRWEIFKLKFVELQNSAKDSEQLRQPFFVHQW